MKNLCSFCGRPSGTNAPFPKRELPGNWKMAMCPQCHSLEAIQITERPRANRLEFGESLIAQHRGEMRRKMISNDFVEILFWFDEQDAIAGFQYTFPAEDGDEVSFTWSREGKSKFHRVFNERRKFLTNTLQPKSPFPKNLARERFLEGAHNLHAQYRECVLNAIEEHD